MIQFGQRVAALISCIFLIAGCEPRKKSEDFSAGATRSSETKSPSLPKKEPLREPSPPADIEKRKVQFAQMQDSLHAVAGLDTSIKGQPDFQFKMPSDDWQLITHAGGNRKSSVWLFSLKKSGLKILVSCAGMKEDPSFAKSAQQVFDASVKRHPDVIREWKVGNFTLRRSFIGFIDERHGEVTVTAFSPRCAVEFNLSSEKMDRNELMKLSDALAEEFMMINVNGGFPTR